jgi:hypothetical protein
VCGVQFQPARSDIHTDANNPGDTTGDYVHVAVRLSDDCVIR